VESDEVYPGIIREWFLDKQVIAYRLTAVSSAIIDAWADLVVQTLEAWDKARPYLALHDLSKAGISLQFATLVGFDTMNIGITSSGRIKAMDIVDANPNFFAYVAINFNLSVSGQVNKVLADADRRNANPFVKYRTFYNRDNSLAWLAEAAKKDDAR